MICYRYAFSQDVELADVESVLVRSLLAVEHLHGPSVARLDAGHRLDDKERRLVVDASTCAGIDLNKLFAGALTAEFGPDAFTVERIAKGVKSDELARSPAHQEHAAGGCNHHPLGLPSRC